MNAVICTDEGLYDLQMSRGLIRASLLALKVRSGFLGCMYAAALVKILVSHLKKYPLTKCLNCSSITECMPAKIEHSLAVKYLPTAISSVNSESFYKIPFLHKSLLNSLHELQEELSERAMYMDMACDTEKSLTDMCTHGFISSLSNEEESEWMM